MNKQLLKAYYDSFSTRASLCLSPGMCCCNTPIRAHSIQNSKVFDLLSVNDHLVGLKMKTERSHVPIINFESIGRNIASTFEGLCSEHDQQLFHLIDDFEFDINNEEQLFLLAYRSVLKGLHASMSKSIRIQEGYLKKCEVGLIDKNVVSNEGLYSVQCIANSCETFEYKSKLDEALVNQNYKYLTHRVFEINTDFPTIACSQLFSNDSSAYKDSCSRIIMNIFPVNNQITYAIFSSTEDEKKLTDDYLHKCINSESSLREYEISKMIIRNSENFFINPLYFKTWSELKTNKILEYFAETLYSDKDKDDVDYFLF
ncbi:hypothetical protein [Labilibaculum euxinus]